MIFLEVNGRVFENFTDIQCNVALDTISGAFSFSATSPIKVGFPIKAGNKCKVLIDSDPILSGYIQNITTNRNANAHNVRISGRDKTSDVIDSTLGAIAEFKAPISLEDVIKRTLSASSINDIEVINNVSGLKQFEAGELVSGEIGDNIFNFIEKHARKRQVILTRNGAGNIVITRASKTAIQSSLVSITNGNDNNILSSESDINIDGRFNKYVVHSQINPVAFAGSSPNLDKAVAEKGESVDSGIRSSRILNLKAEQSSSSSAAQLRAEWEQNLRKARGTVYTCTVVGHRTPITNQIWQPNLLVRVNDDSADISAEMLINEVTYSFSIDGGSTSSLTLLDKNAYTLENNPPKTQKQSNVLAPQFKEERLNQ